MKIAVASQNFRTVTPHAGKTRRFLMFEAQAGGVVKEINRLDLPMEQSIHEFRGSAHPLDEADAVIAGSAGEGFVRRMGGRGIVVAVTDKTDPVEAVNAFVRGELNPLKPCGEHGGAAHHHEHGHHGCGH